MAQQERALRTRETLIRCAAEIFDREGFTLASLTTISTQAGVSTGALHFHFASKTALAGAVENAALTRLRNTTDQTPTDRPSHLQHLVDTTHRLARALREDVVLRAGFELSSDPAHTPHTNLRQHWQHWVETELTQARNNGELRPEVSPEGAMTAVVAATTGFEVLGTHDTTWLSPHTITQFWQLILPTLTPTQTHPTPNPTKTTPPNNNPPTPENPNTPPQPGPAPQPLNRSLPK